MMEYHLPTCAKQTKVNSMMSNARSALTWLFHSHDDVKLVLSECRKVDTQLGDDREIGDWGRKPFG